MRKWTALIIFGLLINTSFLAFAAEGVVLVSKSNATSQLTAEEVKKIFQGKKSGWEVIELNKDHPLREKFSQAVFGKSADEMERYYMKRSMSGKGQPPKVVSDSDSVKSLVAANSKAIGYIDRSKVDDSVKIVYEF